MCVSSHMEYYERLAFTAVSVCQSSLQSSVQNNPVCNILLVWTEVRSFPGLLNDKFLMTSFFLCLSPVGNMERNLCSLFLGYTSSLNYLQKMCFSLVICLQRPICLTLLDGILEMEIQENSLLTSWTLLPK